MTALMDAVKSNDIDSVMNLVRQGCDVNELDASRDVPLIMAAYKGFNEIVRALLEAGADTSAVDPGMEATALHAAAYAGNAAAAKLLIEFNIDVDKQGPRNGYTALHDAIWQGNVEAARVLLEAGAKLDIKSHSGETALDFARSRDENEIASLIEKVLQAG